MVDVDAIKSDIRCSFSSILFDRNKKEEYFLRDLCNTNKLNVKSVDIQLKEKYLLSYLSDNISFLNRKNDYGKLVINCDLDKIYNLK